MPCLRADIANEYRSICEAHLNGPCPVAIGAASQAGTALGAGQGVAGVQPVVGRHLRRCVFAAATKLGVADADTTTQ